MQGTDEDDKAMDEAALIDRLDTLEGLQRRIAATGDAILEQLRLSQNLELTESLKAQVVESAERIKTLEEANDAAIVQMSESDAQLQQRDKELEEVRAELKAAKDKAKEATGKAKKAAEEASKADREAQAALLETTQQVGPMRSTSNPRPARGALLPCFSRLSCG